jgi:type VI protein secretion system component Hcp
VLAAEAKPIGTVTIPGAPYNNQPINVLVFYWTEDNDVREPGGGGGTSGPVVFSGFTIFKGLDAFSPQVFRDVAIGKFVPQVRIDLAMKGGGQASYLLETVAFSGAGAAVIEGTKTPLEKVTFKVFDKITVSVTDSNGVVTVQCWNVRTNSVC